MLKALAALGAVAATAILVLPTTVFASPVNASDDAEFVHASVQYGDLNLSQPRGVYRLERRINYTAEKLCGTPSSLEIQFNTVSKNCISGAVASAKPAFDALVGNARKGTVTVTYGAALLMTAPRQ
jgi:UrcA family protein